MPTLTLEATYSALAAQADVARLGLNPPEGWKLSQHQVETYEALNQIEPGSVVFNTAFTGDGKSLAGYLPSLRGRHGIPKSMAMFPTKELGRDQFSQVKRTLGMWLPDDDRRVALLDADELDVLSDERELTRGDALRASLNDGDFVLTNPDILHYIMQACYTRRNAEAPDRVIGSLVNAFSQFTFDEFHIFEAPQMAAVTNVLLLIRELTGPRCPRFLFLSATPNPVMLEYFERAGIPFREIKGRYKHGVSPDSANWRLILREAKLAMQAMRVEQWLDTHQDDVLLQFFRQQDKHAKGAIIVNSVATAQGLFTRLKPLFRHLGLHVALNTGFDTKSARQQSYDADLLIGTSTVDIGVDFRINFLLFESRDAGTFLQRLGRLGRHDGYERDGQPIAFNTFEAHALVPEWVHDAIFAGRDGAPKMLDDGQCVNREMLRDCVRQAFYESNSFIGYGKRWGGLQAAHICSILRNPLVRDTHAETRSRLIGQYERVLDIHMGKEAARLKDLRQNNLPLHDEALSFRGSSLFDAGVIDERLPKGERRAKRYDLLWLLTNMHVEPVDKREFEACALREDWSEAALKRLRLLTTVKCVDRRDAPQPIEFAVGHDLQDFGQDWFHTAQVLDRITIIAPGVSGLNAINRKLTEIELPVLLSTWNPHELRRRMRLPPLFRLFPMHGRGGNVTGTIAFGRQALMLDVVLRGRRDLLPPQSAWIS